MQQTEFSVADAHAYNRHSAPRWVVSHVLRYWPMASVFLVTTLGMAVAQSLGAVAVGRAFDVVANGGDPAAVGFAALLVVGAYLGYGGCDIVNSLTLRVLGQRVERDAREELYSNLLGKTPSFHGRQRVGNLMAVATGDVAQMGLMVAPNAGLIAESILALVVPLVTITLLRADLLLVPLLFLASFYVAILRYNRALRPVAEGQRESYGALNAELAEAVGGIEVVHGFAQEEAEERRFSRNARRYRDLFVREGAIEARYLPLLFYGLAVGLAFGHALLLWSRGQLSVGQVITYMALLDTLRSPTAFSLTTFAQVQLGLASARRLLGLMAEDQGADHAPGHSAPLRGEVIFENVSFSYDDRGPRTSDSRQPLTSNDAEPALFDRPPSAALTDISFAIRPGETVAIVGQTG
ncbi:MAG: ABC transporter ATP-binding protein, partial [Chloroflexales bacterium]|nr:ABC transporter ATP-binding protein [Chloroflexales bacterium]